MLFTAALLEAYATYMMADYIFSCTVCILIQWQVEAAVSPSIHQKETEKGVAAAPNSSSRPFRRLRARTHAAAQVAITINI
jgi:hypothetical protein